MRGFVNKKTLCYFNTSIQCLFNIPILTNHFLREQDASGGVCTFVTLYQDFLKKYWTSYKTPLDLTPLYSAFQKYFPRFKSDEQHDVQETILCIIDILEKSNPIIRTFFYGKKIQETIWPSGKTVNEEDFSIHLVTYKKGFDLNRMLSDSTAWNVLEDFKDINGKRHNIATTRMTFSKIQPIFMISFNSKSHIELLQELSINDEHLILIACAIHAGNQHDGHYVSYIRRKDKWFLIDDESVVETELPHVGGCYLMTYIPKNR
jgi:ubiquitin C-terminal hydrolase